MQSLLTVTAAAASRDLVTLATMKDELGVTGSATDARIGRWITEASGQIDAYLDRTLAQETVTETFRWEGIERRVDPVLLQRYPVSAIASVTEDADTALDPDLYELDSATGRLWRLDAAGCRVRWQCSVRLVIAYTGGYALPADVPAPIEIACQRLVKQRWYGFGQDPNLRRTQTDGVGTDEWFAPTSGAPGLPAEITDLLDPFRRMIV